jgi:hypothetical protein
VIEDPDHDRDEPTTDDDRPRSRPWLATTLAALCALTLIGGLVLVYWLHDRTEEIDAAEQDRAEVIEAAETFTVVWNTFRPKDASTYVERVAPLLTSKFESEFTNASEDVIAGITQQRLFSKGEVLKDGDGVPLIGISSIDQDSAQVLVVADANRVANRQRVVRHWRWQVSLAKVDGEWLVDSFEEV